MRLVGVYDPAYKGKRFFNRYEDLVSKVDAVDAVVPADSLPAVAKLAVEEGKHVFIEKPVATNHLEALELKKFCDARPEAHVMVGFIERFNPVFRRLHFELKLSRPETIFCQRSGTPTLVAKKAGVLVDLAIHDIDLLQWILGKPTKVNVNSITDFYFGQLELFFDGTKAFIISDCLGPKVRRWAVRQNDGVIHADFYGNRWRLFVNNFEVPVPWHEPLRQELHYFISCILRGVRPSPSVEDGVNALELLAKVS